MCATGHGQLGVDVLGEQDLRLADQAVLDGLGEVRVETRECLGQRVGAQRVAVAVLEEGGEVCTPR